MPSSLPALRAAALLLALVATVSCGRADAAARQSKADAGATASGVADTGTRTRSTSAVTPLPPITDSAATLAYMQQADRGRLLGPDSAMWVVMISDFQCPYCKQWHDSSMARLQRDYIAPGKIRFAYLHLPLESIHPHARAQAQASLCAGIQGKFWPYADALFASYNTVKGMSDVAPLLSRLAGDLALDVPQFDKCRTSGVINSLVQNDIAQATQAGVQSTPTFIVGGFVVQGALPYDAFRQAIDSALVIAKTRKSR